VSSRLRLRSYVGRNIKPLRRRLVISGDVRSLKIEPLSEERVRLVVEDFDDLWRLSFFVKPGDLITARTDRQVKLRDEGGDVRGRKRILLGMTVRVEKVEFQPFGRFMRFLGRIERVEEGMEWAAQRGDHHAISVGVGDAVEVQKSSPLDELQLRLLRAKRSAQGAGKLAMILSIDMNSAALGELWSYGLEKIATVSSKREEDDAKLQDFFREVERLLSFELSKRNSELLFLIGPEIVLDEFRKHAERSGIFSGKKIEVKEVHSSYGGEEGLALFLTDEVLQHEAVDLRLAYERRLIGELFRRLSEGKGFAAGMQETATAAQEGRVEVLLISSSMLENPPSDLVELVGSVQEKGGQVELLSEEGGRELKALGGVVALLRY